MDRYNFEGVRALIRVDFNVPLDEQFQITDDTRIRATLPTITKILRCGGSCILMSHLGRPNGGYEEKFSLKHLLDHLSSLLNTDVKFAEDCIGESALKLSSHLNPGEILLLENLRFHPEEKTGEENFSKLLARLGDVYINDAFGTAHRAHASTTVVASHFPDDKFFGYLIEKELENVDRVLNNSEPPFTAILGGAKISGKIDVITNLLNKIDNLIIGGGMSYTFIKSQGGQVGNSLVEEDKIDLAKEIMELAKSKNVNLLLPEDSIIADDFSNEANTDVVSIGEIPNGWMGLDIGSVSCEAFNKVIKNSKTILWNGPMGVFEMSNFEAGTREIAEAIATATANGTFSLIGGGDSVAAINKYDLADKVSYVSTGGGALLEYIEGKELPGIQAILD